MYALCSQITVGGKAFNGVHEVVVRRSVYELGATATIKVPVTAVLKQQGQPSVYIETAKSIRVGDPVEIRLGYNGSYNLEFKGYVRQLNLKAPLEIACEDAFYLTRERSITHSGKTTLEALLKKCGLQVGYAAKLTLSAFSVSAKPVAWVLGKLKTDYGLCIYFDMEGRVYASEPHKLVGDTVRYRLRENVISDDDLTYQHADDVKLKVKAVCIYRDGTKVEATVGADGGREKTVYFYDVKDQKELSILADAELKRSRYDGYAGKLETFLFPFAAPGMVARVEDYLYRDRSGSYYVEGVETTFGTSGARRKVDIGVKV